MSQTAYNTETMSPRCSHAGSLQAKRPIVEEIVVCCTRPPSMASSCPHDVVSSYAWSPWEVSDRYAVTTGEQVRKSIDDDVIERTARRRHEKWVQMTVWAVTGKKARCDGT